MMKLRLLVVFLAAVFLAGLSGCGGDNTQEKDRDRTKTVVAGFTKTPTVPPTVTPTGVPTGTVATRTPGGPTPTPCIGGLEPMCGNGVCETGERCDDGAVCLPTGDTDTEPTFQDCSENGECPAGETCEPVGGDGCARNCTLETRRVADLDPERSGAVVRFGAGGAGVVNVPLSGTQVLITGEPRDEVAIGPNDVELTQPGEVPIVLKADEVGFNPAKVGILACACIKGVPVPGFGPELSGRGLAGCGEGGLTDINVMVEQDHNTTPGSPGNSGPDAGLPDDPNCDAVSEMPGGFTSEACLEGQDEACSEMRFSHGVCNSPRVVTFSGGQAPRGATVLMANTVINLLMDAGACGMDIPPGSDPCPHPDYGPDCVPCTDDDVPEGIPNLNVTTSGTSTSVIYDNTNVAGTVNMQVIGPGEPTDCDAILSNPDASLSGVLVTSFPSIDAETIADSITITTLASQ
jgi:hypothetical protein